MRFLTLITIVQLALSVPAFAQGARGTVRGTVVGPAGTSPPVVTLIVTNLATNIDRRGVSEPDGEFVFGGLVPGTYRVRVDAGDAFAPWTQEQVVLAPGATVTLRVALLPRVAPNATANTRATLSGTVTSPDGRPQGGVVVVITAAPNGADRRVVSEPSGAYSLGGLAPGAYRLRVETSIQAAPFPVAEFSLAGGEARQLDIRLQPTVTAPIPDRAPPGTPVIERAAPYEPPELTAANAGFELKEDRWEFEIPDYQRYAGSDGRQLPFIDGGGPFDPYNQNQAKADFPIAGSTFLNLNLQVNSNINPRRVANNGAESQLFNNDNFVAGLELFGGSTVFEPKRWAARVTAVVNVNVLSSGSISFGNLKQNPASRRIGIEEAFVEKRLAVTSPAFDAVTVRAGMQNFNSDFRGYLFADNQLGVRMFGNARGNHDQFNVAYFSMRNRDVISQLHDVFDSRQQDVVIGNYFIQDFVTQGYTFMVSGHLNRDRGPDADDPRSLSVAYAGVHGDGRWGSWSVSHAFYEAFGTDDDNEFEGGPVDIRARMFAVELSRDADWLRYRGSFMYASGDDAFNPTAGGFDSITDNPNLAGGQFMYWTQQGTKVDVLPDRNGLLSEKFTLLPSLRSKFTDRANFVNPGLMMINGGVDLRISPQLKVVTNASWLQFADNSVVQILSGGAGFEDKNIGLDLSFGAKFRPFVNENLFVVPGVSMLLPRGGFATALGSTGPLFSAVAAVQIAF